MPSKEQCQFPLQPAPSIPSTPTAQGKGPFTPVPPNPPQYTYEKIKFYTPGLQALNNQIVDISNQMASIRQRFNIQFSATSPGNFISYQSGSTSVPYISISGELPKPVLQFTFMQPPNWKGPPGPPGKLGPHGKKGSVAQPGSPGIPGYWGWGIPTR